MNKYSNENEVYDVLINYFDNEYEYAVLLDGQWGCGKTHFIKNMIIDKLKNKYKFTYISLYNVSSLYQLKMKLLFSFNINGKFKRILEKGTKIFGRNSKVEYALEVFFDEFYNKDNIVIFLDDLERCSMPINEVMGFINNLVEHSKIKVVFIADENKIGKIDEEKNIELKYIVASNKDILIDKDNKIEKNLNDIIDNSVSSKKNDELKFNVDILKERSNSIFTDNILYNQMKEKTIGKTIYYKSNIESIYDKLLASKNISDVNKKYFTNNNTKKDIISVFEDNSYFNLRTLKRFFENYNEITKISNEIINRYNLSDEMLNKVKNELLLCILFSTIEFKISNILENHNNEDIRFSYYKKLKYRNNKAYIRRFDFIDDYIKYSKLNAKNIDISFSKYLDDMLIIEKDPNDPLVKLDEWFFMEDSDVEKYIHQISTKIENNIYSLEFYSRILLRLIPIKSIGIENTLINKIFNNMLLNLKKNIVVGSLNEDRFIHSNLNKEEVKEFNEVISKIKEIVLQNNNTLELDNLNNIFKSKNWGTEFLKHCDEKHSEYLQKKSFANILDIDKIIRNIKEFKTYEVYKFYHSLISIYRFANISDFYMNDLEKLIELKEKLKLLSEELIDKEKTKYYGVITIVDFLDSIIDKLK